VLGRQQEGEEGVVARLRTPHPVEAVFLGPQRRLGDLARGGEGSKPLQFSPEVADNSDMGLEGSSFEGSDPGLGGREPYLRQVLDALEDGRLDPYEYTQRVLAINAATSTDQMAAIVDQIPTGTHGPTVGPGTHVGLDAVDLALLAKQHASPARSPTARYVTLAVVFVLFAVLIGIGMWLATHVPAVGSNQSGTVTGVLSLVQLP
jgi:hypothetical protein